MAVPCANELTDGGPRLRARVQVSRHEDGLLLLLAPERPDGSSASRWLVLFESCIDSDDVWSVLELLATARAMFHEGGARRFYRGYGYTLMPMIDAPEYGPCRPMVWQEWDNAVTNCIERLNRRHFSDHGQWRKV